MQKRSQPVEVQLSRIRLDDNLPIHGGLPFVQRDKPITFLHVHDCLEVGYCYRGSGIFVVGEKVLPFQGGDVSFINHTEMHLAQSARGTDSDWTWIYLDPVRLVRHPDADATRLDPTPLAGAAFNNLLTAKEHPEISRVVQRMIYELRGNAPGRADALRALAWELMTLMHRLAPSAKRKHRPPQFDRLAPALQVLTQQYTEPVDVKRLADHCRLSVPHFRRLFQASLGRSPREYWLDLRIRMAASLLRTTSKSVLAISHEVGFDTLSSFNRQFHAKWRMSPRQWRKSG